MHQEKRPVLPHRRAVYLPLPPPSQPVAQCDIKEIGDDQWREEEYGDERLDRNTSNERSIVRVELGAISRDNWCRRITVLDCRGIECCSFRVLLG